MADPNGRNVKNYIALYVDSLSPSKLIALKHHILKNFDRYGRPRAERLHVRDIVAATARTKAAAEAKNAAAAARAIEELAAQRERRYAAETAIPSSSWKPK